MMSRVERLVELLLRLQTLQHFTVQALADEFHCSRRTMLRDLQALSMMGVPLAAMPGPHGGYRLLQKQRLLPLALTEDEAIGIVLSYEALLDYTASPFAVQHLSALTKLRNALPPEVVQRLDQLWERLVIMGAQRSYQTPLLAPLLQAALDEAYVQIIYESRTQVAERVIYPYGLYAHNGLWYCACFDQKRQQHISLRADRIRSMERCTGLETPQKMSLRDWLRVVDPEEEPVLFLHVIITHQGMKDTNWSLFLSEMTRDAEGNGILQKTISEKDLAFYARLLLPLGREATVESPPELVETIRARAQAVLEQYTH
jgi:predicted DNA-binding transcriptional regulator YafY